MNSLSGGSHGRIEVAGILVALGIGGGDWLCGSIGLCVVGGSVGCGWFLVVKYSGCRVSYLSGALDSEVLNRID